MTESEASRPLMESEGRARVKVCVIYYSFDPQLAKVFHAQRVCRSISQADRKNGPVELIAQPLSGTRLPRLGARWRVGSGCPASAVHHS